MITLLNLFNENLIFRVILLFILGSCIGSFLNVVIFRLPIILNRKWRRESASILEIDYSKNDQFPDKFNLIIPKSSCFLCKNPITVWANIPIFGFLLTRGKCTKCKSAYSIQYVVIELICASLFGLAGYLNSNAYVIFAELVFISIVLCAVFIDFKTFLLPDELTLTLLWLGLLFNIHGLIAESLVDAVLGAVVGYLILWLIYWGFKLATKREGMGYGDFKFLAAILAWVGISGLIPILLFAPGLGILYFITAYLFKRVDVKNPIPFGPFLGISGILVLLYGKYFILPL
ncbi:MAG: prepilin peptidase [Neisseriaceae bacterium]